MTEIVTRTKEGWETKTVKRTLDGVRTETVIYRDRDGNVLREDVTVSFENDRSGDEDKTLLGFFSGRA
jgi:hypothetical protein